jgi:hypothetical protein
MHAGTGILAVVAIACMVALVLAWCSAGVGHHASGVMLTSTSFAEADEEHESWTPQSIAWANAPEAEKAARFVVAWRMPEPTSAPLRP